MTSLKYFLEAFFKSLKQRVAAGYIFIRVLLLVLMLFDFFEKLFYRGQKKLPFSSDPTIEARRALNGRRLPEDLSDYTICLADYDSKATLDFLKPELGWPIDFYREYIKTYAQLIRKRNGKAVLCMVILQDYLTWLKERGLRHQPSFLDKYVEALGQKKS